MSADKYMLMVDDVKITTGTFATNEVSSKTKTNIYPNPTKGDVEIKTDKKIKSVSIYDISGKSLLKTSSTKADLSSFSKGTYLMKIEFTNGTSSTEKVIKD